MSTQTCTSGLWRRASLVVTRSLTCATFSTHDVTMKRFVTQHRCTAQIKLYSRLYIIQLFNNILQFSKGRCINPSKALSHITEMIRHWSYQHYCYRNTDVTCIFPVAPHQPAIAISDSTEAQPITPQERVFTLSWTWACSLDFTLTH